MLKQSSRSIPALVLALGFAACETRQASDGEADAGSDAGPTQDLALPVGFSMIPQNYDGSATAVRSLIDRAKEAGAVVGVFYPGTWPDLETAAGVYERPDAEIAQMVRDAGFDRVVVDVPSPLAPGGLSVPADLVAAFTTFDDPVLVERYEALLADLATAWLPAWGATHVVLHTETAGYFGDHPEAFDAYCRLISRAVDHLHTLAPDIEVAVYGTREETDEQLVCLNARTDYFAASLIVDPPDEGVATFVEMSERMQRLAGDKPFAVYEAGCPSSPGIGSSEALQADIVDAFFDLAEQRPLEYAAYYQVFSDDEGFTRGWVEALFPDWSPEQREALIGWASSLGLRTSTDQPKQGWARYTTRALR